MPDDRIEITDPEIADLVERLASYTEVSPCGYGLRVLVRGKLTGLPGGKAGFHDQGRRDQGRNLRRRKRYVTLTGDRYGNAPDSIEPAQGMLDWLLELRARQESHHKSGNGAAGAAGRSPTSTSTVRRRVTKRWRRSSTSS